MVSLDWRIQQQLDKSQADFMQFLGGHDPTAIPSTEDRSARLEEEDDSSTWRDECKRTLRERSDIDVWSMRWDCKSTGTRDSPFWLAIGYINGMEWGRAQGHTIEIAKSEAARIISRSLRPPEPWTSKIKEFKTVVLFEDSTSVSKCYSERSKNNGSERVTRWKEAKGALANLAALVAQHSDDAIDIHLLNNVKVARRLRTPEAVHAFFRNKTTRRGRPVAAKLTDVLRQYLDEYKHWKHRDSSRRTLWKGKKSLKKLHIVVIIHGYPTDSPGQVIKESAREMVRLRMIRDSIGIQFVQIGNDRGARRHLQELDEMIELSSPIPGIVDVTQYTREGSLDADPNTIAEVLRGGICFRLGQVFDQ
ncbi:von Willebrand factor (vWF) type A domain-containing protein [Phanerochaete sordida]|uniref:von Willebrand factor (VWF) type A domain-containing protein n=1 Tax=Phanerochaete sordida TaxID=48140 RepID=A0A9P3G7N8_9APHY|nr:von Willebrand factor (vWF) type A domain-containing protein [Phanerochaete sordida]